MPKNRICELRKASGMNQRELGTKLGVGQTTVSAWEKGRNEPDIESLQKMAKLFDASIEYIMGYGERSYRRGLSDEQFSKTQERLARERREREIEGNEEEIEEYEETGLTRKEMEELEEDALESEWQSKNPNIYFETYVIETLFETMTKEQRKQGRKIMEAYWAGLHSGDK